MIRNALKLVFKENKNNEKGSLLPIAEMIEPKKRIWKTKFVFVYQSSISFCMSRVTKEMKNQESPPIMMALPPRLKRLAILVLRPIALMAMTMKNFEVFFKKLTKGVGRGRTVVTNDAKIK